MSTRFSGEIVGRDADDSRSASEDLCPARGILWGMILGVPLWLVALTAVQSLLRP